MKRRSLKKLALGVLCAIGVLSCSAGELIRNPDIDRWCGDNPCDWQVQGDVRRVGTWHPNDYAVALLSDDAALIQENGTVDYRDSDCFSFAMVAKIAPGVKVFLELDFLADGSVEFSQRLPVSNWERRTFKVTAPDWYHKVRFIIRKEGPGRAILAEISAENTNRQCTAPPVELHDRPEGAPCSTDDQCADEVECASGRCGGCDNDASCVADQICAIQDVDNTRYKTCVDASAERVGAACDRELQCVSGVCSDGACSECATDSDCDSGQLCHVARGRPLNSRYWPRLCGAGDGKREKGAACTDNRDCESAACEGVEVSCEIDLACRGSEMSCGSCGPELQLGVCR
jgi:hypothetical protein